MIAKKPDGLQQQGLHALGGNVSERLLNRGPNPWAAARTLALEGKPPRGISGTRSATSSAVRLASSA